MIGRGIKNYFKNLKYLLNPLGAIALGFVMGLSILLPIAISSTNEFIANVKDIFAGVNVDYVALRDSLVTAVKALDWSQPLESLQVMLSKDWILQTLQVCLSSFVGGIETYTEPLTQATNTFCNSLLGGVSAVIVFTLLGVIGGYFLVKCLVRKNIAKRTFKKYLLANILDSILSLLIIVACAWIFTLWEYSIFITIVLAFIFFGGVALFEAYMVHGRRIVNSREVINIKNIVKLLVTNMIIMLIAVAIVGVMIAITNIYVGIFLGVALVEIAFVVIGLNAESYVINVVKAKSQILAE